MQEPRKTKIPMTPEEREQRELLRKQKKIEKDRKYRARLKKERVSAEEKVKLLEEEIATQKMLIQRQGQQMVELYAQLKNKG